MEEPSLPTVDDLERFHAALQQLYAIRDVDLYYELTGMSRIRIVWYATREALACPHFPFVKLEPSADEPIIRPA